MRAARFRLEKIESVGVLFCGFMLSVIPGVHLRALYLATTTVNYYDALEGFLFYRQLFNVPLVLITFGILLLTMGWYWKRFELRETFPWVFVGTTLPLTVLLSIPYAGLFAFVYPMLPVQFPGNSGPSLLTQVLFFIVTLPLLIVLTFFCGKWRMRGSP